MKQCPHILVELDKWSGALRYAQLAVRYGQESFMQAAAAQRKRSRKQSFQPKINQDALNALDQPLLVLAVSYHNLACCMYREGRKDSARKWQKRAVEAAGKVGDSPDRHGGATSYDRKFSQRLRANTKDTIIAAFQRREDPLAEQTLKRPRRGRSRQGISRCRMMAISPGFICSREKHGSRPKTCASFESRERPGEAGIESVHDTLQSKSSSAIALDLSNVYSSGCDAASLCFQTSFDENANMESKEDEGKQEIELEQEMIKIRDVHEKLLAAVEAQKQIISEQCRHFQTLLVARAELQRTSLSPDRHASHHSRDYPNPSIPMADHTDQSPLSQQSHSKNRPQTCNAKSKKGGRGTKPRGRSARKRYRKRRGSKDDNCAGLSWTRVPTKQGLVDAETLFTCKRRDSPLRRSLSRKPIQVAPQSIDKGGPRNDQEESCEQMSNKRRGSKDDLVSAVSWSATSPKQWLVDEETMKRSRRDPSPMARKARSTRVCQRPRPTLLPSPTSSNSPSSKKAQNALVDSLCLLEEEKRSEEKVEERKEEKDEEDAGGLPVAADRAVGNVPTAGRKGRATVAMRKVGSGGMPGALASPSNGLRDNGFGVKLSSTGSGFMSSCASVKEEEEEEGSISGSSEASSLLEGSASSEEEANQGKDMDEEEQDADVSDASSLMSFSSASTLNNMKEKAGAASETIEESELGKKKTDNPCPADTSLLPAVEDDANSSASESLEMSSASSSSAAAKEDVISASKGSGKKSEAPDDTRVVGELHAHRLSPHSNDRYDSMSSRSSMSLSSDSDIEGAELQAP